MSRCPNCQKQDQEEKHSSKKHPRDEHEQQRPNKRQNLGKREDADIIRECEELAGNYETSIFPQPPNNSRTIMLGDIHGDLEALKYCLRDCAKVINNNNKWIGGTTSVVLVGDLIDRARREASIVWQRQQHRLSADSSIITVIDKEGKGVGEVEKEEIKILRLINKLSLEAEEKGGKIIKLLGNHGITHLTNQVRSNDFGIRYNTNFALINDDYTAPYSNEIERPQNSLYNAGKKRWDNYAPGETRSELLTGCGGRMIVKIGKWIIVHGGILPDLINKIYDIFQQYYLKKDDEGDIKMDDQQFGNWFLEKANELLRKKYKKEHFKNKDEELFDIYISGTGLVWDRHLSDSSRFKTYSCNQNNTKRQCDVLLNAIFGLLGFDNDSKIVVAHSPQYSHGLYQEGTAWSLLRADPKNQTNPKAVIFGPVAQTGGVCCNYNQGMVLDNKCPPIPGITYQCPDMNGVGQIWRIDVAMSRGFDILHEMFPPYFTKKIADYWEGRKPQVLEVTHFTDELEEGEIPTSVIDEVRVIKSKKSLPRFKSDFMDFMATKKMHGQNSNYIEGGRKWSDIDPATNPYPYLVSSESDDANIHPDGRHVEVKHEDDLVSWKSDDVDDRHVEVKHEDDLVSWEPDDPYVEPDDPYVEPDLCVNCDYPNTSLLCEECGYVGF